jgi:hypothetical protein
MKLRDTLIALDLILGLYDGRSGKENLFKPSKMARNDRTSDENLAMDTFAAFFHLFYMGESAPGVAHADNAAGKARVQMIRGMCRPLAGEIQKKKKTDIYTQTEQTTSSTTSRPTTVG